jgi:hypothetical protein
MMIAVVLLAACGAGGQRPAPPAPPPPVPDGACAWIGQLRGTMSPMHGDATCFRARPFEVDLHAEATGRLAPPRGGELGLVIEDPPAAIGKTADGAAVNVQGAPHDCQVRLGISFDLGTSAGMFATFVVEQDAGTRRVEGAGSAERFCRDANVDCGCRASLRFDGSIDLD